MAAVTLEEVLALAEQLSPEEQMQLTARLQHRARGQYLDTGGELTIEAINAYREELKAAGAFNKVPSLAGMAGPPRLDISFEELQATIREASTEWEQEIDEFFGPR